MSSPADNFVTRQSTNANVQRDAMVTNATAIGVLYDALLAVDLDALISAAEAAATQSDPIIDNVHTSLITLKDHRTALQRLVENTT